MIQLKFSCMSFVQFYLNLQSLLRAANKPPLVDVIWALGECSANNNLLNGMEIYVFDSGSLLLRLPWLKRASFNAIRDIYIDHVKTKYPQSIVVFDGYDCGPSTINSTHLRRSKGKTEAEVHFSKHPKMHGSMLLQSKTEEFLANAINKQNVIHMLSNKFQQHGCETLQAAGDTDLFIVQTAVKCANQL